MERKFNKKRPAADGVSAAGEKEKREKREKREVFMNLQRGGLTCPPVYAVILQWNYEKTIGIS